MSRRKGRILAFQALYSYDVGQVPLDELLKFEWENDLESDDKSKTLFSNSQENSQESENKSTENKNLDSSEQETYDFARILISGTINHLEKVDSYIKSHLSEKWTMERINRVSLAVMRISVFALLYQKDISPSIIIDEAISIVRDYGEEDSYKFVNAILDNINKEILLEN